MASISGHSNLVLAQPPRCQHNPWAPCAARPAHLESHLGLRQHPKSASYHVCCFHRQPHDWQLQFRPCHWHLQQQQQWRQQQRQLIRSTRLCAAADAAAGAMPEDQPVMWQWRKATLKKMLTFMAPAMVIPLGDPLMSVIDTVCIGQFAGTQELAAMGPVSIIFAFSQYIFQALQIAAVGLISDALRAGQLAHAERTLGCALTLALGSGLVVWGVLELFAEQLIASTGAEASLIPVAVNYMRIRAFAAPAVLTIMVVQASQLAQQDSQTPALTTVLSILVSLLGNVVAVAWMGLGLTGAAATTVLTQVVGAVALLWLARSRGELRPRLTLLTWRDVQLFGSTMGPLSVTYLCKNLCYILLQTTAASLDLLRLAAHQAVFSVWNLLAFCTAPLEQAALAFMPRASSRWQRQGSIQLLGLIAACIGVGCGLISAGIPLLQPQLLTRDPAVWGHMAGVAPQAMLSMLLAAADVAASGVLLAYRDLAYLARAFVLTLVALGVFITVGVKGQGWGLGGVWWGLVFFFGARAVQSTLRLVHLSQEQRSRPASSS